MPAPDTRSSLLVVKSFTYRDSTKLWSCRYHFTGAETLTDLEWAALSDAVVDSEKACYADDVTIVKTVGNDASTATSTNPHGDAVFQKTYSVAGTGTFGSAGLACPGDCAAVLRYSTDARTSKNHPVYLFNYFHGIYRGTSDKDILDVDQKGAINDFGDAWVAGFSDGTTDRFRCGPRGAVGTDPVTHELISHRDFRR